MLSEYLEKIVGREAIESGEAIISKEDSAFSIATDKGALKIKPVEGGSWKVMYLSIDPESNEEIFNGDNKIIKKWYEEFSKSKTEKEDYVALPFFQEILSFKDAKDVSSYILIRMVATKYNQNNSLN